MIKKGFLRLSIFFLYLVSLLPFWLLYFVADVLFLLLYYVIGYRRKVVQKNLLNSFPEKSGTERAIIERKYFKYLADLMVETIKAISISEKELRKRVKVINTDIITNYHAQGKSVVAVGGHYCNWELAGLIFPFYTDKKFIIVYKPLTSELFDKFFIKIRSRFGTIPIPMKQTIRKMIEYKNEPTTIALLSDQTPVKDDATYFTSFLNQPTAVFLGIEKLATSMDKAIIFYDMRRVKRGYYDCTVIDMVANAKLTEPYEITKMHVEHLESIVREAPEYWLWSHRRWKFKPN